MSKDSMQPEELSDSDFQTLLKKSCCYLKDFVADHPQIVYKGLPLAIALYIFFPIILFAWSWLPWIWAIYEIYNRLPKNTIIEIYKLKKSF